MLYYWLKALHLISMVAWFAGLFYIFRLFVYHVENKDRPDAVEMLKVMEHKLYYYITFPAMLATLIFGISLLTTTQHNLVSSWIYWKLFMVAGLVGYNFYSGKILKELKKDRYPLTSKQCRMINEIPTIFLIGIVFVAVFRMFL